MDNKISVDEKADTSEEAFLNDFSSSPYKFGFKTVIETEAFPKGLNVDILDKISQKKNEPKFMKDFRFDAFKNWKKMKDPAWSYLKIPKINYQDIQYYSIPKTKKKLGSLDDVDPKLLETFDKLGISLNEQKLLTNVAVDAVFDSVSIGTTFKKQLQKVGVIFSSITDAIKKYPEKVKEYQNGKKGLIGLFMGEIMKLSKGKTDPKKTNILLNKKLNESK